MSFRITHIRMAEGYTALPEKITHVRLQDGKVETVKEVVKWIDHPFEYYYFTESDGSKAIVETVHPTGRDPYIRTAKNDSILDNLLSLPKF